MTGSCKTKFAYPVRQIRTDIEDLFIIVAAKKTVDDPWHQVRGSNRVTAGFLKQGMTVIGHIVQDAGTVLHYALSHGGGRTVGPIERCAGKQAAFSMNRKDPNGGAAVQQTSAVFDSENIVWR